MSSFLAIQLLYVKYCTCMRYRRLVCTNITCILLDVNCRKLQNCCVWCIFEYLIFSKAAWPSLEYVAYTCHYNHMKRAIIWKSNDMNTFKPCFPNVLKESSKRTLPLSYYTACLVVYPNTIESNAYLFNVMMTGRT